MTPIGNAQGIPLQDARLRPRTLVEDSLVSEHDVFSLRERKLLKWVAGKKMSCLWIPAKCLIFLRKKKLDKLYCYYYFFPCSVCALAG